MTQVTKIQKLPQNYRGGLARETTLAIATIQYVDGVYWNSQAGHQACRDLLQVNFLDSLAFCHNIIAEMTGEPRITAPDAATFNPGWRREHLQELIDQINEARYLGATRFVSDSRDEYRIPAVQGLYRATYMLRGIIEDFTAKEG